MHGQLQTTSCKVVTIHCSVHTTHAQLVKTSCKVVAIHHHVPIHMLSWWCKQVARLLQYTIMCLYTCSVGENKLQGCCNTPSCAYTHAQLVKTSYKVVAIHHHVPIHMLSRWCKQVARLLQSTVGHRHVPISTHAQLVTILYKWEPIIMCNAYTSSLFVMKKKLWHFSLIQRNMYGSCLCGCTNSYLIWLPEITK